MTMDNRTHEVLMAVKPAILRPSHNDQSIHIGVQAIQAAEVVLALSLLNDEEKMSFSMAILTSLYQACQAEEEVEAAPLAISQRA